MASTRSPAGPFSRRPVTWLAGRSRWAVVAALTAVVPLLTGMTLPPSGRTGPGPAHLLPVRPARPVPVYPVPRRVVKVPVMRPWHRPDVTWPAAGAATVSVTGAPARQGRAAPKLPAGLPAGSARAGSLPVWVGAAAARPGQAATTSGTARVRVTVAPRQAAQAAGISGVIFTVAPQGTSTPAVVRVSLDYSAFAAADGGGYAARLGLVRLPACALTTPQAGAGRHSPPGGVGNNTTASRLGADVSLTSGQASAPAGSAAPAAAGMVVLAATTSPSGSGGDYSATPLSEAGTWAAGGSSGAFTYSYPIPVPPVPGGLAPKVGLAYNSQAVDGLTSATNSQASWVGDGWDYQPGYIERSYQSCEQTSAKTGDLCWSSNNVTTLSLAGRTTTIVDDASTGWHPEADNGDKVQYISRGSDCTSGTVNGTYDGGYWVITDTSGTRYYFGLSQLPGYASGDAATSSAWTVPVYATSSGQPCYNSTFSKSHGPQAWRWNLDYVVDPHSDAMAYFYNTETNYYAADNGTTATASYTQAGALAKIEYGLRDGAVYGVTPAAQVTFTAATDRTDVPTGSSQDLACSSGASCNVVSPTFWGKYKLITIATQALNGSSLHNADSWALAQTYPSTGDTTTPPSLWLASITRTGQDGTSITLPPVRFAGLPLANRVETSQDLNDGYSIISRFRLSSVTSETGGVTGVTYDTAPAACTSGHFPPEDASTTVCYPAWWTPPGASSPVLDWWNKYVVTAVTQQNTAGGGVPVTTGYCYGAAPGCLGSAGWHYNDDALTRSKNRTWDQWRGFGTVTTSAGGSPDPVTKTVDTYFQGMDGDYQSGGGTASASLTSTRGDKVTDSPQFAAMNFEHITYNGSSQVSDQITLPWSSAATATQSQPSPLPALKAFMTGTSEARAYTALAAGGSRESDTAYTHDSYGRVTSASAQPDVSDPSQTTCTTTSYATSTSSWILDLPSHVQVTSVPCTTTPSLPADAVSDTLTFYDGATTLAGDTPAKGDVTMTQLATSYSGSTPVYTTKSKAGYDQYGRVTSSADADNRTTTTAYTPAAGAEPTSVTVTDPMTMATTTSYDPVRDLPLSVTSPAGYVTTRTYDALGRVTAIWKPGHAPATSPADYTFSYLVSATAPSVITTGIVNDTGGYVISKQLYDSLGRPAETQTATLDGGRDITDVYYNSDGWKLLESSPYYTTGAPSDTLVAAPDSQVPSQTGYVYDGAGRITRQIAYKFATETWETDTAYGGNYATVSYKVTEPGVPLGGTPQTTYTDGRGLTSYIYQYHSNTPPASPPAPGSGSVTGASGWDQTAYTHTPAGQLASITDAAANAWTRKYNLAGDQTSQTAPDTGTTTSSYDPAGQLLSVTDARAKQTSWTYDPDGRKTAKYDTTGSAPEDGAHQLAAWAYDTLAKGQPTSSTAYTGGNGGTAYTQQVTGYNTAGQPTGSQTVISAGPLAGTYKRGYSYDPYTSLPTGYYDYAAGGLPAEQVAMGHDTLNRPISLGSSLGFYVAALSYTELGQPQEYAFGTTSEPAWLLNAYDQQTNRLTSALTQAGTGKASVSDISYAYDSYGNVTSEGDSATGDYQCYHYDYAGRLADAWAQGSAGCATTPSASALGGPSPYWQHLAYDPASNITTSNWTYNSAGTNYTTTASSYGPAQPHTLTSQNVVSSAFGSWTNHNSYDPAGNLTDQQSGGYLQQLTWNNQDKLAAATDNQGDSSSYIYDASGNLLLQTDNTNTTTLYLPDEQLVATTNPSTGTVTVTGTRYYTIGGVTAAARTSAGTIQYLTGDQHGTSMAALDSATLTASHRYYTPFGALRWPYPATWPGNKGFVGGTTDTTTALTNLGAREYNPAAGTFTNPDPLLDPSNPQDLNPYAYAASNPATLSDPSGLIPPPGAGGCPATTPGCPGYTNPSTSGSSCPTTTPGCPGYAGGGGNSGGRTNPTPVVEVSPHVYVSSSDPRLAVYRAAWDWVTHTFGPVSNAGGELNDWARICWNGPYRGACTGQFGAYLMAPPINPALGNLWSAGGITLLGAGGAFAGVMIPAEPPDSTGGGEYDLYHGTDVNSARNIVRSGINRAAADQYGGDGKFYTTTDQATARTFAAVNPAEGEPAVVGIRLSPGVSGALERGIIEPMSGFPGTYTVSDWAAFNDMASFDFVDPIP
jgi:RHS repeat-associated protein